MAQAVKIHGHDSSLSGAQAALIKVIAESLQVTLGDIIAGERNNASATNSYLVTRNESNGVMLDDGTSATAVSGGVPAHFMGVYISTALTGTLTIAGLRTAAGVETSLVIPDATPAGFLDFHDARCETALIATKSSASDDDNIVVFWRPIS